MSAKITDDITFDVVKESLTGTIKKYVVFDGRARRQEFWIFFLCSFVVGLVLGWIPVIGWLISLAVFIPSLTVGVRRLHDTERSGFWLLLGVVPSVLLTIFAILSFFFRSLGIGIAMIVLGILLTLAGIVVLIIFWVQEGTPGNNKYGPNPKAKSKK